MRTARGVRMPRAVFIFFPFAAKPVKKIPNKDILFFFFALIKLSCQ